MSELIPALWQRFVFAGFSQCKLAYTKVNSLIGKTKFMTSCMMFQTWYVSNIKIYTNIIIESHYIIISEVTLRKY